MMDRRIFAILTIVLAAGLPFYLGHQSTNPVFFGRYSSKMMLINSLYITILFTNFVAFIRLTFKSK